MFSSLIFMFAFFNLAQFGGYVMVMRREVIDLSSTILILTLILIVIASANSISPLFIYLYVYGDITAQLIEWASMLKGEMVSSRTSTPSKFYNVKKFLEALSHMTGIPLSQKN